MLEHLLVDNWAVLRCGEPVLLSPRRQGVLTLTFDDPAAATAISGSFVSSTFDRATSEWQGIFLVRGVADSRFFSGSWQVFRFLAGDQADLESSLGSVSS